MDAFATFRLNDPHDNFSEDEVPRFKREHPEWTMGGSVPGIDGRFRHLLNFAVKEVRDFKVRFIEEVMTLRLGRNALVFTLIEREAEMASPVRVENMDVCITYV